jgi:hypothetical protein
MGEGLLPCRVAAFIIVPFLGVIATAGHPRAVCRYFPPIAGCGFLLSSVHLRHVEARRRISWVAPTPGGVRRTRLRPLLARPGLAYSGAWTPSFGLENLIRSGSVGCVSQCFWTHSA